MTVHAAPQAADFPIVPCCGRTLLELPDNDTIAVGGSPAEVNCPGMITADTEQAGHDPKAPSGNGDAPTGSDGGPTSQPATPGAVRDAADIPLAELRAIMADRDARVAAFLKANPIEHATLVLLEQQARWEALLDGLFGGEDSPDRLAYEISTRECFLAGLQRAAERSTARREAQASADRRAALLDGVTVRAPRPPR